MTAEITVFNFFRGLTYFFHDVHELLRVVKDHDTKTQERLDILIKEVRKTNELAQGIRRLKK